MSPEVEQILSSPAIDFSQVVEKVISGAEEHLRALSGDQRARAVREVADRFLAGFGPDEAAALLDTARRLQELDAQGAALPLPRAEALAIEMADAVRQIREGLPNDSPLASAIDAILYPGAGTPTRTELPDPMRTCAIAKAPNAKVDRELALALAARKDEWLTNTNDGHKYYQCQDTTVIYRPDEVFPDQWFSEVKEAALKALERRFQEMRNDLAADVIDILNLHWLQNGRPSKAKITLRQVLSYRGVKAETKTLELHWSAIRDVRSIRLRGDGIDAALFDMDAARTPQGNLFHLEAPAPDLVCVYSPGAFIGAALREQERYFAAYIPKILSLHPYREMMAKRLARYLRSDWRLNPEGYMPLGPRRYRTWNAHLASAGIHLDDRDHRDPKDFVKNLDRAMSTLYDKGIIGDWCEEMYHPDDQALPMPRFNWLPSFLGRRVHIPPPAEVIDDLERTAIKRAVRKEQMALAAAKPARGKGRKKSP